MRKGELRLRAKLDERQRILCYEETRKRRFPTSDAPMSAVSRRLARILDSVLPPIFVLLNFVRPVFIQTIVGTGSIVGTVSDPFGSAISGAKVTIIHIAKG